MGRYEEEISKLKENEVQYVIINDFLHYVHGSTAEFNYEYYKQLAERKQWSNLTGKLQSDTNRVQLNGNSTNSVHFPM